MQSRPRTWLAYLHGGEIRVARESQRSNASDVAATPLIWATDGNGAAVIGDSPGWPRARAARDIFKKAYCLPIDAVLKNE